MTLKKLTLAGLFLAPLAFFAQSAEAGEYCREYTKTIRVGGNYESGYGTACMQPDGSWMIVSTRGSVDPFDDLRRNNVILVSDDRPVYYAYGPSYRPVTYYPRQRHHHNQYYGRNNGLSLSFFFRDDDDRRWNNHRRWDRDHWDRGHKRHGHGHHKGRGRGHDRD